MTRRTTDEIIRDLGIRPSGNVEIVHENGNTESSDLFSLKDGIAILDEMIRETEKAEKKEKDN